MSEYHHGPAPGPDMTSNDAYRDKSSPAHSTYGPVVKEARPTSVEEAQYPAEEKLSTAPYQHEEISFLDILIVLAKYKFSILGLPIAAGIIGAGVSFLMPPTFTATAQILPPQRTQSSV